MSRRKSIYKEQPKSILYMGQHYVLAAEGDPEPLEEVPEEAPVEEEPPKKKRSSAARVRIDECKGNSVTFEVMALVHSYDGSGIPGLPDADGQVRKRSYKVKQISSLKAIPKDVLSMIQADGNGDAVMDRIEKLLRVRPSPPLYFIRATGGWNWSKRNGDKGVAEIQRLLEYLRGRRAILFSYCNNKIDYGSNPGLI